MYIMTVYFWKSLGDNWNSAAPRSSWHKKGVPSLPTQLSERHLKAGTICPVKETMDRAIGLLRIRMAPTRTRKARKKNGRGRGEMLQKWFAEVVTRECPTACASLDMLGHVRTMSVALNFLPFNA